MSYVDVAVLVSITLTTVLVYVFNNRRGSKTPLPPGPSGIPFFGNIFQVNALKPYPKYREWALKYGDIFHLRVGPQNVVVLNTAEAADEFFVNRSSNYSGRASLHVVHDILSDGQRMVFMSYGREWKTVRRAFQAVIGPNPSRQYRRMQELESRTLLYDLAFHGEQSVTSPHQLGPNGEVPERHWFALVRRFTASIFLNITYGQRAQRVLDNPQLHKIYDVVANMVRVAQPGNHLADVFPVLRKLPDFLAQWRVEARRMHIWEMELWGKYLADGKAALREGVERRGFVNTYLRARSDAGLEHAPGNGVTDDGWMRDKFIAYAAGTILEAGSDTTAISIESFVLLMLSHPHVLRRAREEIDAVVSAERMPVFEDQDRLPFLVACIKETLRRRPPAIMGIPHKAEEDDIYQGYLIPKGSTVIGNIWAIHMDPNRFPNPIAFDPERFYVKISPPDGRGPDTHDRDHYVFGWGRRFCQGSYVAEASLFIALSRLVWGIDFAAPVNPRTGKAIIPDLNNEEENWTDGFNSGPKMYNVTFKPRSEVHLRVIQKYFDEAQMEWQAIGLAGDER